jgi:hypothetical protein
MAPKALVLEKLGRLCFHVHCLSKSKFIGQTDLSTWDASLASWPDVQYCGQKVLMRLHRRNGLWWFGWLSLPHSGGCPFPRHPLFCLGSSSSARCLGITVQHLAFLSPWLILPPKNVDLHLSEDFCSLPPLKQFSPYIHWESLVKLATWTWPRFCSLYNFLESPWTGHFTESH